MKKIYQTPSTQSIVLKEKAVFLEGSPVEGLEGFGGNGGSKSGGSADSRGKGFWDDEE